MEFDSTSSRNMNNYQSNKHFSDLVNKTNSENYYDKNLIFIIIGPTSRIGALLSSSLLAKGFRLILVVKSQLKLSILIEEHLINRAEAIIEKDLSLETNSEYSILNQIINQNCKYFVINAMEFKPKYRKSDVEYNKVLLSHNNLYKIININKEKVIKVLLFSSDMICFPFSISCFLTNLKFNSILEYLQEAENLLVKHNFNFLIIRTGRILNSKKDYVSNSDLDEITITQNYLKGNFIISDVTLVKLCCDLISDYSVPNKCLLQCFSFSENNYLNKCQSNSNQIVYNDEEIKEISNFDYRVNRILNKRIIGNTFNNLNYRHLSYSYKKGKHGLLENTGDINSISFKYTKYFYMSLSFVLISTAFKIGYDYFCK
jgi:hypothetical protein